MKEHIIFCAPAIYDDIREGFLSCGSTAKSRNMVVGDFVFFFRKHTQRKSEDVGRIKAVVCHVGDLYDDGILEYHPFRFTIIEISSS